MTQLHGLIVNGVSPGLCHSLDEGSGDRVLDAEAHRLTRSVN